MVYTANITLQQAINAEPVILQTLDGRMISAPVDSIIGPKTVVFIPYEGMPIFWGRHFEQVVKGHLFVKFVIEFPKTLREDQRLRI